MIFIADLIACSTCFGAPAARKPDTQPSAPHHTDNLKTKAPNTTGSNHLYNTLELLMMGIIVPETCWTSNKICNKNHLLHLFGVLYPHINDDARSKSLQTVSIISSSSSCCCCCGSEYLASYCGHFISTERDSVMRFKGELIPEKIWTGEERCQFCLERNSCFIAVMIIIHIRPKRVIFTKSLPLIMCTIFNIKIICYYTQLLHVSAIYILAIFREWQFSSTCRAYVVETCRSCV